MSSRKGDWERASRLEWLETNGLGGYASSTAAGANTRRYHGLLVAATTPPVGRMVLLSKLDERISAGGNSCDLSTNQFPGAIHPRGFELLDAFEREMVPVFEYVACGVRLRKTIAAIHGENTTVMVYEVLDAPGELTLELTPFVAARDYHGLAHANSAIRRDGTFEGGIFSLRPYDGVPAIFLATPGSTFTPAPDWHYSFEYAIERERGLDAHEDLFTPGHFSLSLARRAHRRHRVRRRSDGPRRTARQRDRAYHQGTVWPWLLGPYLTALVRVRGALGVAEGRKILFAFEAHLDEACVGSVSEIFDATPPYAPHGCPAQAWSVGEILRAAVEDLGMTRPTLASPVRSGETAKKARRR